MRKISKKMISAVLCLAMTGSMLAGCGQNSGPGSEEKSESGAKSLDVWLPPLSANQDDKEVWDKIMDGFEEENDVTVNVEIVPWGNYEEKYLTGITSGEGPDVGYMYME